MTFLDRPKLLLGPRKKEKDKNGVAMTTSNWGGKVFHSSKHLKRMARAGNTTGLNLSTGWK